MFLYGNTFQRRAFWSGFAAAVDKPGYQIASAGFFRRVDNESHTVAMGALDNCKPGDLAYYSFGKQ